MFFSLVGCFWFNYVFSVFKRVMVLDKGEIVEFDSPTNLLKNKNSRFYSLAKSSIN
jgi:ABC-type multidrug transport system fused ATPase/permease subunit